MKNGSLRADGFIMPFMTAGPGRTAFSSDRRADNQLELEARLRADIVSPKPERFQAEIRMGEPAKNGCPWTVQSVYGSCFVDVSDFYSTLQKIDLEAAAVLVTHEACSVRARVWTYMAAGLYCNGRLAGEVRRPVYKPIEYLDVTLQLEKGRNLLYLYCENLGVRDTRNILGVQILDHQDQIRVGLADERQEERVFSDIEYLDRLKLEGSRLFVPETASSNIRVCFPPESPDFQVMSQKREWRPATGGETLTCSAEAATVLVRAEGKGYTLVRQLEAAMERKPQYRPEGSSQLDCWRALLQEIASVSSLNRGEFGFAISNLLARRYLGQEEPEDRLRLLDTLRLIEKRVDCSDFLMCGLLRYLHYYSVDQELEQRVKEVLLNYRYWMNMDGADAMCFWSENHSLMFYMSAMDAGARYPQERFARANMTGQELFEYGKGKVLQWLSDVETYGFEEFLSTVYLCVTFAALLNVIDFAEEELSRRARAITDTLLCELSRQTFQGCVIAPMGRVYREVIYPFRQGAQSLVNLIDPAAPYAYGEGWMAFLATSAYRFPEGLAEQMHRDQEITYTSGNAQIRLKKTSAYCLTSVQSPRTDGVQRWRNIRREAGADTDTHEFNKSLNECFHGTTFFQPGVYGYQQHLWYAALSPEAVLFVNHPGTTSEHSDMRPGYWYGNGILPAIRQERELLGTIYQIPDSYPVSFTHVYCPMGRFAQVIREKHWLFLEQGEGVLALWSSGELTPYDDTIFDCELRVYGRSAAYLCLCGRREAYGSLERFAQYARSLAPVYEASSGSLKAGNGFALSYQAVQDDTQFVD